MEIRRDHYLDKLIHEKHNGLIKVITGIRRCGKSYLLNNIFYNHLLDSGVNEQNIIKFAFDSELDLLSIGENSILLEKEKRKVDPKKFLEYITLKTNNKEEFYLLLDEIQLLDCFESVLNSFLYKSNFDVYVTGSNARFLSSDIITEFAGRGDEIRLQPLSFSEFLTTYDGDQYAGLNEYMLYGGIPLVVGRESVSDKSALLKSLFDEIYLRDITFRHRVRNYDDLEDILNILSSSIGSLTNPEKLKNTFASVKNSKISSNTVKQYLDYLEDSFLIREAYRYDIKGKAYISTPRKYYFADLGLRNARINFRQFEEPHSMENVIFNELLLRGYNVDVGVVSIVDRDREKHQRKQLEIDFVCNQGYKRYYIQSAFSIPDAEKMRQETRPFRHIDDSFKKIVVTHDMTPKYYDDSGIMHINIYDFLLNFNSLDE